MVIQSSSSEKEGFSGESVTSNDEGQIDFSSTDSPDSSDDEEGSNTSDHDETIKVRKTVAKLGHTSQRKNRMVLEL